MEAPERDALEREIRRHRDGGELQRATALAIEGYGPEIFGFLVALHRRDDDAAEVFSSFMEKLWRGLPAFEWHCSFRTWAYAIARNVSASYRREARRRARRQVPLSGWRELSALEQKIRSGTASYLRTQSRTRFAALRESLPPEDQALLMLRVDRQLAWTELAQVMQAADAPPLDEPMRKREAARLRKRFQLIKDKLYALGRREGLIGPGRDG
ncbi:MAG TPA: sigma-70 family RNA polymerase sigma factor [Polyangia bacterium]|jgi:RNA polymerase sigma-70 factor (ECF subfamily)|nr:sigma-70 family RNA polymerase sigma factor [Polyangia bacterium]